MPLGFALRTSLPPRIPVLTLGVPAGWQIRHLSEHPVKLQDLSHANQSSVPLIIVSRPTNKGPGIVILIMGDIQDGQAFFKHLPSGKSGHVRFLIERPLMVTVRATPSRGYFHTSAPKMPDASCITQPLALQAKHNDLRAASQMWIYGIGLGTQVI